MASNIDQLVQDAVKSVERKLSADMRKFGDYIVQRHKKVDGRNGSAWSKFKQSL